MVKVEGEEWCFKISDNVLFVKLGGRFNLYDDF